MKVPIPVIVRGTGADSGSAELAVIVALQQPAEVLCSAPADRLGEMLAEVLTVLAAAGAEHDMRSHAGVTQLRFVNGSRIVFRTPRRDGAGVRGINPHLVWLDQADTRAETEAVEQVRRSPPGLGVEVDG